MVKIACTVIDVTTLFGRPELQRLADPCAAVMCREPSKPIYQRRISSVSRLLTVEWSSLLDPPGILVGADDGILVYEASEACPLVCLLLVMTSGCCWVWT